MKNKSSLNLISAAINKIKSNNSGFSLFEMMVACTIMVLVSAMMVTGTKLCFKIYQDSRGATEGEVLAPTLSSIIKDELRYTGSMTIDADGELESFFSNNHGGSDESGFEVDSNGQLIIGEDLVLSKWAYIGGLKVENLSVNYVEDAVNNNNSKFQVRLRISDVRGHIVADKSFEVKPINNVDITRS